jgi:DNA-nicking Smr family endonuclease
MARRVRALTETDAAIWAAFAHKIKPLPGKAAVIPPPEMVVEQAAPAPPRIVPEVPAVKGRLHPVGIGGHPAGVDTGTWQRFNRGKLSSARKLDLHGMTAQTAFHALRSFLRTAHADHVRCVEVVTGKGGGEGGGVLRREFPMWLNLPDIRPLILAASHPHAANPGSVRLLLRRTRA